MPTIPATGREYVHWTPTPATSDQLEVSLDGGTTWSNLTAGTLDTDGVWTEDAAGTVHAILIASPTATSNPPGALNPGAGVYRALLRYVDTPEVLIRQAGQIVIQ